MRKLSKRNKIIIWGLLTLVMVNMNTITDYLDYSDHALIREMRSMRWQNFWGELAGSSIKFNPSEDYSEYLARMKLENRNLSDRPSQAYRDYLADRDVIVLKHIPLGTSAEAAMEICRQNGFDIYVPTKLSIEQRSNYPGIEEYVYCVIKDRRWYWIGTDEYRVFLYLKNNQVVLSEGAQFSEALGGL